MQTMANPRSVGLRMSRAQPATLPAARPAPKVLGLPSLTVTKAANVDAARQQYEMELADRKYARTVYDFPQWQKHRSPLRLLERLTTLRESRVIKNIVPSLVWVASVSTLVVAYTYCYENDLLPAEWPALAPNKACQSFISNTSVALSLLLVFRTNASYGRWDEARKMWGLLVNRSRDLARQTQCLFPDSVPESKAAMTRWLVAFPRLLRVFLQPEVDLDYLRDILTKEEVDMLKRSANPQVKAIHVMSELIHSSVKDPVQQLQMSQNLTQYHDILGGCERLLRAPIPVSYTRHTARFLFCWITLLPFTLDPVGPWDVPVVVGIAAVLAAIEEIGVQCEEPFGILPLERISDRIRGDVENTLKDDQDMRTVLAESIGITRMSTKELVGSRNGASAN